MSDDTTDVTDLIEAHLEDGWRPEAHGDLDDAEWSEYAWSTLPCPHCGDGILLGLHDPEYLFDDRSVSFATLRPPEDDDGGEPEQ